MDDSRAPNPHSAPASGPKAGEGEAEKSSDSLGKEETHLAGKISLPCLEK